MSDISGGHTIKGYDEDLMGLHDMVMEMGSLVEAQLGRVIHALDEEDPDEARDVIARDRQINDMDTRIDEEMISVIARRQPVAKDLRNVVAMNKTVTDLERIGDEVRKIAALVEYLYNGSGTSMPCDGLIQDVREMSALGKQLLHEVLDAFNRLDVTQAVEVIYKDAQIEEKFRAALRRLATYIMEDSRTVGYAIEAVLALRALERIGSHTKNIAGYTIYLSTGKDVRHVALSTIIEEVVKDFPAH